MLGYIIGGIIVIVLFWFIASYNGFVKERNRVDEAFSTMDVFMKKRYDLIPNLVETVKGYAKHEKDTLEEVVSARNKALASGGNMEEKEHAEGELNQALSRLLMLTESYPDLKANTEFEKLHNSLNEIETEISQSRRYYNGVVRDYNTRCESFPSVIIANIFGFSKRPFFEVSNETERENVKVEF